jgi:hypothetical protein
VWLRLSDAAGTNELQVAWVETFGRVAPGQPLLYEDSYGRLSLAVNQGSAVVELGIREDAEVVISREPLPRPEAFEGGWDGAWVQDGAAANGRDSIDAGAILAEPGPPPGWTEQPVAEPAASGNGTGPVPEAPRPSGRGRRLRRGARAT